MEGNVNGVRESLAPCFKQLGLIISRLTVQSPKAFGWYFSLPEWVEKLTMLEGLHASLHFRGSAIIRPAGF